MNKSIVFICSLTVRKRGHDIYLLESFKTNTKTKCRSANHNSHPRRKYRCRTFQLDFFVPRSYDRNKYVQKTKRRYFLIFEFNILYSLSHVVILLRYSRHIFDLILIYKVIEIKNRTFYYYFFFSPPVFNQDRHFVNIIFGNISVYKTNNWVTSLSFLYNF